MTDQQASPGAEANTPIDVNADGQPLHNYEVLAIVHTRKRISVKAPDERAALAEVMRLPHVIWALGFIQKAANKEPEPSPAH